MFGETMHYTIRSDALSVTASACGAQLMSLCDSAGTQYLWQGDPAYWSDRAPILFPYVGRLKDGCYDLDGERYSMQIHGFAPYRDFTCLSHDDTQMEFELTDDPQTRSQFPRAFSFRVGYALRGRTLFITFHVENRDEKPMYFGLGGHPGFRVPFEARRDFEEYRIRFDGACEPERIEFDEACLRTGHAHPFALAQDNTLALTHTMFARDAVVLRNTARQVTLQARGSAHGITVAFPQMPYLSLWHMPHTDAPYVCIEPWCSLPAYRDGVTEFETQEDLLCLRAGECYSNTWSISVF